MRIAMSQPLLTFLLTAPDAGMTARWLQLADQVGKQLDGRVVSAGQRTSGGVDQRLRRTMGQATLLRITHHSVGHQML